MEILTGYQEVVRFAVPEGLTTATISFQKDGAAVGATTNADVGNGVASKALPYAAVASAGIVVATVQFNYESQSYNLTKQIEVVSPYLEKWEISAILGPQNAGREWEVEKSVRHIINTYCQQKFHYSEKTLEVAGKGDETLRLPERLIRLDSLTSEYRTYNTAAFAPSGDGWFLRTSANRLETIKQMPSEQSLDLGPVITTPYTAYYHGFHPAIKYSITGAWGWQQVPEPVREAAKLLINDYACEDSLYRDRYLKSINAADWRLEFVSGAYRRTGNVRADQLLAPYVIKRGWAVI